MRRNGDVRQEADAVSFLLHVDVPAVGLGRAPW